MSDQTMPRHALVFGASGLVGRHLILALTQAGARVTAAVRTPESGTRVKQWLHAHGPSRPVAIALVDFKSSELLRGGPAAYADVTEIHNCAGSFRFGMPAEEARSANVGIVESVLNFAADLPSLHRVVHISGYRVGGQNPDSVPWSRAHRSRLYTKLGGYEASKVESDAVFQAKARELGLPWTIVNPATVIGDSETGESEQYIGIASTIKQLWRGTATALPAGKDVFVPVLTVDYLAAFMAAASVDPDTVGKSYWVLDDATPPLGEQLSAVGHHLGAKVPKLRIPISVIRRLPAALTQADPETLGFLSTDRYPTGPAVEFASRHHIPMPDVHRSLNRWADYLAAHRFGAAMDRDRRYIQAGAVRLFELGTPDANRLILPGLPVNADAWSDVAQGIGARAVDLPGLGLSGGAGTTDWEHWLPVALGDEPAELIGHSIGAAAAVLTADRFPDRVTALTLVSPFFLQPRARAGIFTRPVIRRYLRHASAAALSRRLTGTEKSAEALTSTVEDLKRGRAKSVVQHLGHASSKHWRDEITEALKRFSGPVRIITGSEDPLTQNAAREFGALSNVRLLSLPGAGHHPQLTHGTELIELLHDATLASLPRT
ncbi:alpha/beta fold hydrolase [Leucobacter chromiireducens]|uniref:alpha/beta fold hydrolase n=1 Tax=Leucobacter chromiireducens TaxID=283877 RepID=UPI003F802397